MIRAWGHYCRLYLGSWMLGSRFIGHAKAEQCAHCSSIDSHRMLKSGVKGDVILMIVTIVVPGSIK